MAKRKIMIYLATVVLTIGVLTLCLIQRKADSAPFSIQISTENGAETIDLWEKERGEYYAFLPSYAGAANMTIRMNTDNAVRLNGEKLWEGMPCDTLAANVPYDLLYSAWGVETHSTVTFLYSANIATMYVDTQSGSMEYIHREKGNEESGSMRLYTHEGVLDYGGELKSINGRGNNTWEYFEKKPYSISLKQEANLLGMGSAQKWILLADADDASNMRNKIVYDFADRIGLAFSPDCQWVDLYLNGEYTGLYLLCERNELHQERIDISREDSFVVSLEKSDRLVAQNYEHIVTEANQALRVHYLQDYSAERIIWLEKVWQSVENALLSEDGIDPEMGKSWTDWIDQESWVKKYLIEEVFANGDACFISQYFYLDGAENAGKIYAGPVWDYDHTMGTRVAWALMIPNSLYANRLHVKDGFDAPWFHALYNKEAFFAQMTQTYETEFLPVWKDFVHKEIDDYAELISVAHSLNMTRWNIDSRGIEAEKKEITAYMQRRLDFLSGIWLEGESFYLVKADQGFGGFYGYYAITPGEWLKDLPTFEDTPLQTFCGWYYKDTNEPFDPDRPITEDIEIYAKWQDKPTKKLDQLLKLVPLGVIAVMGVGLLWIEMKRLKRSR